MTQPRSAKKSGGLDRAVTFGLINASISRLAPMFRQVEQAAKSAARSFRQLRKVLPPDPPQEKRE